MDPMTQKLQIAQALIQQLLMLVPPSQHAAAQVALDAAKTQLAAVEGQPAPAPLVAPVFVPPAKT
jgi:hypothetical protein